MIIKTPKIAKEIINNFNKGTYREKPIIEKFPGYDIYFLMFHPFLKIKPGFENLSSFSPDDYPSKIIINKICDKLTWSEFLKISGILNHKKLDSSLAYYHCAYMSTDKYEYEKLINAIEFTHKYIIPPDVGHIPEIFENLLFEYIKGLGYQTLNINSFIDDNVEVFEIDDLIDGELIPWESRIQTDDDRLLIVSDFDQRFSYIIGDNEIIQTMIEKLDLEGFYCDNYTVEHWSIEFLSEDRIKERNVKKE